jgi:hypothetical protein
MLTHRLITEAADHCSERATTYPSGSDERAAYNVATLRLLTMPLDWRAIRAAANASTARNRLELSC